MRGHEHGRVVADAKACGRARARHGRCTGTVGTVRTDVAHGTVSTRRMGRGQERRSWWYLGWSGTRRGRRVLRGDDCNSPRVSGPGQIREYCSSTVAARIDPILEVERNPDQLKYQA